MRQPRWKTKPHHPKWPCQSHPRSAHPAASDTGAMGSWLFLMKQKLPDTVYLLTPPTYPDRHLPFQQECSAPAGSYSSLSPHKPSLVRPHGLTPAVSPTWNSLSSPSPPIAIEPVFQVLNETFSVKSSLTGPQQSLSPSPLVLGLMLESFMSQTHTDLGWNPSLGT